MLEIFQCLPHPIRSYRPSKTVMSTLRNGLAKLRWSLNHRGVLGSFRAAARKLSFRHEPAPQTIIHPFDRRFGVDTSGFVPAVHLTTGHPNDLFGTGYCGVAPSRFQAVLDHWLCTAPQ